MGIVRRRIRVTGVVQGVGFRPFVHAMAARYDVAGFVANDSAGVLIEAEGRPDAIAGFQQTLQEKLPPLARIESFESLEIPSVGETAFVIHASHVVAGGDTPVPPDISICPECLTELFDPTNRRYRYPFINCTNCGPRFTIIRELPYDRSATTMASFPMCTACALEYHDPQNRRFHAQPIACPDCGPRVWLDPGNLRGEAALEETKRLLRSGAIVAIKGVGGFHLACDATNDEAVLELRRRKGRVGKPLALMASNLEIVLRYAEATGEEARILCGRERPIVLLNRRADATYQLAESIAPGQTQLGFVLPYSPLHALLLEGTPLVMTSGNRSDEPIARTNEEARERLAGLADAFLLHDREIHVVCDDSVVRAFHGSEMPIRRSRGYAPLPVALPVFGPAVFAAGGELKATFCLARGRRAYLSQHVGDVENLETQSAYERALEQMQRLFRIAPEVVACDLHPGYRSSLWSARFAEEHGLPLVKVQHHHAHAAALMAEHGMAEDAQMLAVVFDGTGFGPDGAIWGGEFLRADYRSFDRLGHLNYVPLPGGDSAVKKSYRMALAHLAAAGLPWEHDLPCVRFCPESERRLLERQLHLGLNSPPTSSCGRLFDAAASLIGVRHEVTYEAQGAIELETLATQAREEGAYSFAIGEKDGFIIDPAPVWRDMVQDLRSSLPADMMAAKFHRGVARLIAKCCVLARLRTGLNIVGLTGGVFQNVLLLGMTSKALQNEGFEVLTHRIVPPNDGGLALGQAMVASVSRKK